MNSATFCFDFSTSNRVSQCQCELIHEHIHGFLDKMAKISLSIVHSPFGNQKQSILLKNHQSYSLFESGIRIVIVHCVCVRLCVCMCLCEQTTNFFVIMWHESHCVRLISLFCSQHCTQKDTRKFSIELEFVYLTAHTLKKKPSEKKTFRLHEYIARINLLNAHTQTQILKTSKWNTIIEKKINERNNRRIRAD